MREHSRPVPWQITKIYLMKIRDEAHEKKLLGFGVDSKTANDDNCIAISPVSKEKYVNHYPALRYLHRMHVYSHSDLFCTCSASESCRSVAEGPALPKFVSLAMRGQCRFARG